MYQLRINECENVANKKSKNPKGYIDYSQRTDDVYEKLEEYNPTKKVLTVFDDKRKK